ncbi:MAG: hypothetical protein O2U61_03820 [Candidatus Bathyarchaeota archaeon]|nr:hypothetical protein [Candidatus Bathyarchaeota archaeon]
MMGFIKAIFKNEASPIPNRFRIWTGIEDFIIPGIKGILSPLLIKFFRIGITGYQSQLTGYQWLGSSIGIIYILLCVNPSFR